MALEYCQGKWFHDAVYQRRDPVARQVKSLWASEGDTTYQRQKEEIIVLIGRAEWDALAMCRDWGGAEAYYHAIYHACYRAIDDAIDLGSRPLPVLC